MQATAAVVDMFFTVASTARATAGPSNAIVWIRFLTVVAGTPAGVEICLEHAMKPGRSSDWSQAGLSQAESCKLCVLGVSSGLLKLHLTPNLR